MAEEQKQVSVTEVRRTIATALAAAFAFVIALIWKDAVIGALEVAGIVLEPGAGVAAIISFVITAVILSAVMVIAIVIVSRWGGAA
jgi:hypothetical protein